jgi:hypothetical protein
VRTFNGWGEVSEAGWLEIDLVAHCGKWMEGRFLWTLVATDIATGWSECLPLLSRDGASVMAALRMMEELLPFPLRGIDITIQVPNALIADASYGVRMTPRSMKTAASISTTP